MDGWGDRLQSSCIPRFSFGEFNVVLVIDATAIFFFTFLSKYKFLEAFE
jgi:hypothetical protein